LCVKCNKYYELQDGEWMSDYIHTECTWLQEESVIW
jgi:hypothetical protein